MLFRRHSLLSPAAVTQNPIQYHKTCTVLCAGELGYQSRYTAPPSSFRRFKYQSRHFSKSLEHQYASATLALALHHKREADVATATLSLSLPFQLSLFVFLFPLFLLLLRRQILRRIRLLLRLLSLSVRVVAFPGTFEEMLYQRGVRLGATAFRVRLARSESIDR